jgi:hypothetical protein
MQRIVAAAFGLLSAANLYKGEGRPGLAFLILALAWLAISFTRLGGARTGSNPGRRR